MNLFSILIDFISVILEVIAEFDFYIYTLTIGVVFIISVYIIKNIIGGRKRER